MPQHVDPRAAQAVIGAGAAGLAAIRELVREGHAVTAFEQGPGPGGVWVYTEQVEDDPLGHSTRAHQWLLVLVFGGMGKAGGRVRG